MKKYLCVFCCILQLSALASDELTLSPSGENSGLNKYERVGKIEKDLNLIVEAFNRLKKEQDELKKELNSLLTKNKDLKEENSKATTDNAKLLTEITALKNELMEQKKSLEQVRTSLYGEEGQKEKDALLKAKK